MNNDARLRRIERTLEANTKALWQAYINMVAGQRDDERKHISDAELGAIVDYLSRVADDPATVATEYEAMAIAKWDKFVDDTPAAKQLAQAGATNDWALGVCKRIRERL